MPIDLEAAAQQLFFVLAQSLERTHDAYTLCLRSRELQPNLPKFPRKQMRDLVFLRAAETKTRARTHKRV